MTDAITAPIQEWLNVVFQGAKHQSWQRAANSICPRCIVIGPGGRSTIAITLAAKWL